MNEQTKIWLYKAFAFAILIGGFAGMFFVARNVTPVRVEGNIRVTNSPTPVPSPTEVWCGKPIEKP